MSIIITLIIVALVLVAFEVILPGGILGGIAALCVIVAMILTHIDYGIWYAVLVFAVSSILILALILIEFKVLKSTSLGSSFFLKETVTGHSGPTTEVSLIGKNGQTLTRLNPSGKVTIDGKSYEAVSQDGYIEAKQEITIVAQRNFNLTVKQR